MSSSSPLHFDYLLVGGGLAGSLLALALFQRRGFSFPRVVAAGLARGGATL